MIARARFGLVALVVAAAGCHCHYEYRVPEPREGVNWYVGNDHRERAVRAPTLGLSDDQVADALAKERARAARHHEQALDVVAEAKGGTVADIASAVLECYEIGDRDAADSLADGTRHVWSWDQAQAVVALDCHYRSGGAGGALEVTIKRKPGALGALAIAFPPGTYGVADAGDGEKWTDQEDDRKYGRWPSQQDLGFLRAPVLYLAASDEEATVEVPIACASFHSGPPADDQRYTLHRFEPGSAVDRLLVALCAREKVKEPEAQLAVWLARNDITWDDFVEKGGARGNLITFGTASRVLPRHAKGAAKLLIESGTNPTAARFFGGNGVLVEEPSQVLPEKPRAGDATP
ncbi:MAG TPA: hypothetical protein VFF73_23865 [Planctomycetota bacterium]|nr:hypothetical protein [Planctomycetota bacterium]